MAVATGTALAIGAGAGLLGNYLGGKEQGEAIKSAAETQAAEQAKLLDFQKQVYGEGQPFRDVSLQYAQTGAKTLPSLYDYVMNPQISQGAQMAATEGQNMISQDAATAGSPTSGPAQIAKSNFLARLMAGERDRQVGDMFRLAGFGGNASGMAEGATAQAGQLAQTGAGIGGNIADLQVAQGNVKGGLYNTIGQTAAQLPMQYQLYNMMNQPGGQTTQQMPQSTNPYYFPSMQQYPGYGNSGGGWS